MCSQIPMPSHIRTVCLYLNACLAGTGTGSLAFNTCMPASPQRLATARCLCKTPLSFNRLKMELTPAESPREYTPQVCGECISTLHMNNSRTLYWEKGFSFSRPSLVLCRPQQLTTGGHFFKVKMLTFTNRDGPQPRLLLTICASPYGKDAFMPQIARRGVSD